MGLRLNFQSKGSYLVSFQYRRNNFQPIREFQNRLIFYTILRHNIQVIEIIDIHDEIQHPIPRHTFTCTQICLNIIFKKWKANFLSLFIITKKNQIFKVSRN